MMDKTRILLAEDDQNLGNLLREYLNVKGYEADLFPDGEKAYAAFQRNPYDLCILDVMMPARDGLTLASDIRMQNSDIPIIFLTAKSLKDDVFEGFKAGGDDYITKPFSMEELLYRMDAILRRTKKETDQKEQQVYKIGKYEFDTRKQVLVIEGKGQKITTKEAELLKLLCIHSNKMLDRNLALKAVWSDDSYYNARSMDVYIT
ncbi:MAG: response regulator transcription factor, partial [Bacteroidota bacterium]